MSGSAGDRRPFNLGHSSAVTAGARVRHPTGHLILILFRRRCVPASPETLGLHLRRFLADETYHNSALFILISLEQLGDSTD